MVTGRFAQNTTVSVAKSRAEIEDLLAAHGADAFAIASEPGRVAVMFRLKDRAIRFVVPLPARDSDEFQRTPKRRQWRSPEEVHKAWEQACRSRWRALLLVIKAKLEAIEVGVSTIEQEFLAFMVTGSGATIGEALIPELSQIVSGRSPLGLLTYDGGVS